MLHGKTKRVGKSVSLNLKELGTWLNEQWSREFVLACIKRYLTWGESFLKI